MAGAGRGWGRRSPVKQTDEQWKGNSAHIHLSFHHHTTNNRLGGRAANFSCTWQLVHRPGAEETGINKGKMGSACPPGQALSPRTAPQTTAGPSVVSRRRTGARRRGTDGQESTGTFQLSDGRLLPNKSPPPCSTPPNPTHTAPGNHGAGSKGTGDAMPNAGAQGRRLLPPPTPPHLQVMGDAGKGVHSLSCPGHSLPLSQSRSLPHPPQPINPLCAQQPEFMGSFKNKSLKRLSSASQV